jgi:hypothetical protein
MKILISKKLKNIYTKEACSAPERVWPTAAYAAL